MPWTYDVPPEIRMALEVALAAPAQARLAATLAALTEAGFSPSDHAAKLIGGILGQRSFGPADVWIEMVDDLRRSGIEPPTAEPGKPEPFLGYDGVP